MDWHNIDVDKTIDRADTSISDGLAREEAAARLKAHGANALAQKKDTPLILRFFAQFKDFMVIILLFAAGLSYVAGRLQGEERITDSIIILVIVCLNAVLGLVQESRAKKAMEALKQMSHPEARVVRDGQVSTINAQTLVVGDVVILETGDVVPADIRLTRTINLQIDEAALTGESIPSEKDANAIIDADAPVGERVNMAFSGAFITYGRGVGVVVATGMNTQIGKIASLIMEEKSPQTPLQNKLAQTGKVLGIVALAICAAIFAMGLLRDIPPLDMFITAVSLAVAAIPEGLVAIVSIMLAIGVTRMAKRNAIIRKLPAVETLGSATVICSDKTGTLTQNKMKILEISNGKSLLKSDGDEALGIIK
ncbi:MAG: HAD-IC family P-type ATPase, partial [Defluviitaleaceae bacterium]|nr:HAD-IC family P-type ATPase [Defluviitaleaceae bacterium]